MATEESTWDEEGVETGGAYEYSDEQNDNSAHGSNAPGDLPDDESEDGADYDPESVGVSAAASSVPDQASNSDQQASSKPKMTGGFLVEASDDEDDGDAPTTAIPQNQNRPTEVNRASEQPQHQGSAQPEGPALPSGIDQVAFFEARINEDPRGDMDAWLALIANYKQRGSLDELRKIYGRFLEVFPQAADIWCDWIEAELGQDNFVDAEQLFGRCLMSVANVRLWTVYLNYIRRRNDLNNDASGQARRTITQSYEFVIDNIGVDRDSGDIWQDYVQFIKNGPGQIGGTGWQDQQKMDQLRKAYHRAINVPMSSVNALWKEYDQFEMGLNKVTGRKFIQERSPGYMSAKSGNIALDNITRNLKRTNLPKLPPAPGFDGDEEFKEQVELWKKWIAWEKEDPLVLEEDEPKVYQQRVIYCYKQALMALRFWPEIWMDAAEWCYTKDIRENEKEFGTDFLVQGIDANPESVLLALKHADRVEANYPGKEGDKSEYANAVREPHDKILDTLYALGDKSKEREKLEISAIRQQEAMLQQSIEEDDEEAQQAKKSQTEERVHAIQQGYAAENSLLSKTISFVWIALARAMRRIQGKGSQTEGGLRKVFTDARHRGRLSSDVYVAVALLESIVYKDPVGSKIFERGARLFPNDEHFMIEYLKYLHAKDDTTNARVVFETCVNRLVAKPETLFKAKPLYVYFHKYESQYGELSQIAMLEDRMAELFPEDPRLKIFVSRYSTDKFDPVSTPIIISKAVQMRPKRAIPAIEQPPSTQNSPRPMRQEQSPRPQFVRATASPKRPFGLDDEELNPPKRLARGVSPLKGAAGRRLDQQRRNQSSALHRDITFLLGILPPSNTYDAQRLNPSGMVNLLRDTHLPDYPSWRAQTGGQYVQIAQSIAQTHGRQTSRDFNRANSPYGQTGSSAGYRQSPLGADGGAGWPNNSQFGGYRYQ